MRHVARDRHPGQLGPVGHVEHHDDDRAQRIGDPALEHRVCEVGEQQHDDGGKQSQDPAQVEGCDRPALVLAALEQERRDQKAAQDHEHVDAEKAAWKQRARVGGDQEGTGVVQDDERDRDRAQPVERRATSEAAVGWRPLRLLSRVRGSHTDRSPTGEGPASEMRDDGAVFALRVSMIVAALAACAWFALGIRSSHDADRVSALVSSASSIPASQARADYSTLDDAELLNPDQSLELLRAEVALHSGQHSYALAVAKRIVAREPGNPNGWLALEVVSDKFAPALNRLAQLKLAQLVPPTAG